MPLPTFVVVGAQKSGTTTLHDMLGQHPNIWMSDPKELHFFDKHRDNGLDWYADRFRPAQTQTQFGESTPYYMYNDRARQTMLDALPEARFIAILREPVSRAYSHYWFARSKGREPLQTFAEAVEAEPQRLANSRNGQPAAFSYLDRGRYLRQLASLAAGAGRDRLLVVLTEDLQRDPHTLMKTMCRFLEVDDSPSSSIEVRSRNTFADRVVNSKAADQGNSQPQRAEGVPADRYPPLERGLENELRERMREDNEALASWLQRDLNAWLPR